MSSMNELNKKVSNHIEASHLEGDSYQTRQAQDIYQHITELLKAKQSLQQSVWLPPWQSSLALFIGLALMSVLPSSLPEAAMYLPYVVWPLIGLLLLTQYRVQKQLQASKVLLQQLLQQQEQQQQQLQEQKVQEQQQQL